MKNGESGFTLIELLATSTLLSIVMVSLFLLVSTSVMTDTQSSEKSRAVGLASAIMESIKIYPNGIANSGVSELKETVADSSGLNKDYSIDQTLTVPPIPTNTTQATSNSVGPYEIKYLSGNPTGFSYSITLTTIPSATNFLDIRVDVSYKVGGNSYTESAETIHPE